MVDYLRQGYYVDGKKKKRGLFGVLFGGIFGGGDDHEGDMLKVSIFKLPWCMRYDNAQS